MAHADVSNLSGQVASSLNRANSLGFLTDALVAAADTRAGLKAAINNVQVHADQQNFKILLMRVIDFDPNITDAAVLNLTSVAGLIALVGSSTGQDILE